MKNKDVLNYLNEILSDAKCELNYNRDYELLIATVLSAQTTDKKVNVVTKVLFDKYDIYSLVNADIKDIECIIKILGTQSKKAKYIKDIASSLVKDFNGVVPNDREYLEKLSGVGRKTCNVVLSNLFNEEVIAVDTHVKRVSIRLGYANVGDSEYTIEKKLTNEFDKKDLCKLHHQLVLFGRYYCKAKNPMCDSCKLKKYCLYYKGKLDEKDNN